MYNKLKNILQQSSLDSTTVAICMNICEYIFVEKLEYKKDSITPSMLRKINSLKEYNVDEILIAMLVLSNLTPKILLIDYIFIDDGKEMILTKEYVYSSVQKINPFSGANLSNDEFNKHVNLNFKPNYSILSTKSEITNDHIR